MKKFLRSLRIWTTGLALVTVVSLPSADLGQEPSTNLKARIAGAVSAAYQTASAQFPCKVKTRGKPRMLRWQEVDRCLNSAADRVNWEALADTLEKLREGERRLSANEFWAAVEESLSAHALTYDKVLAAKNPEVLLPLTNSLLKFLPEDSLHDLRVIDKSGTWVGNFRGTYSYERTGGLSTANRYRLTLFQYEDRSGNVQQSSEKLLLDSFGVPWNDAKTHRGFRLPLDKLTERK